MARRLTIEWRHLDADGRTCDRCSDTGLSLRQAVEELRREWQLLGVEIVVRETKLGPEDVAQSNLLLFNGRPLEDLLQGARVVETDCPSCAGLIGSATCCRAIEFRGALFERVSAELIRAGAVRALAMETP